MVTGEHVPDRLGERASDVDLCDVRAALFAEAALGAAVALVVGGVAQSVQRGFDQRPAQIPGPVLGKGPRRSTSPDWITRGHRPV